MLGVDYQYTFGLGSNLLHCELGHWSIGNKDARPDLHLVIWHGVPLVAFTLGLACAFDCPSFATYRSSFRRTILDLLAEFVRPKCGYALVAHLLEGWPGVGLLTCTLDGHGTNGRYRCRRTFGSSVWEHPSGMQDGSEKRGGFLNILGIGSPEGSYGGERPHWLLLDFLQKLLTEACILNVLKLVGWSECKPQPIDCTEPTCRVRPLLPIPVFGLHAGTLPRQGDSFMHGSQQLGIC